jgi:hypothetical protein
MATTINTQTLADAKATKLGTSPAGATYMAVFMESLTKTLTDLQNFTGMVCAIPADISENIALDSKYYSVISFGLDFYLQDSNLFTANPIPDAEDRFFRAKKEAQRLYLSGITLNTRLGTLESYTTGGLQQEGYAL